MPPRLIVFALVAALTSPIPLLAQSPRLHRLLPESEEIALARSAAPAALSDSADVYVLARGGHVQVVQGTNGHACLVARDHLESLYPICFDSAAAATVMQVDLYAQRLRERGIWGDQLQERITGAFDSGALNAPLGVAVAYMLSPCQTIYAGETGRPVGRWHPHLMVYGPGLSPQRRGFGGLPDGNFAVSDETGRLPHFVVFTTWAIEPAEADARGLCR